MQFSFAKPELPVSLRVCRSLVWTQASFVVMGGLFVVVTAVLFGSASSIPFRGDSLSGGRAAALGAVYLFSGAVLVYLGIQLGRLSEWARTAIVSMEVFLAALLFFRSFELSLSVLINVGLAVAVVWLLFAPGTSAALSRDRGVARDDGADA